MNVIEDIYLAFIVWFKKMEHSGSVGRALDWGLKASPLAESLC